MTEMVKKPGTDRRHTTWQLARLTGCADPDRADVAGKPGPETLPGDAMVPLHPAIVAKAADVYKGGPVACERTTGDYLSSDECERRGYWFPDGRVVWLGRVSTCGNCNRSWDWGTPAGRCPWEAYHGTEAEDGSPGARFLRSVEDAVYEAVIDYWEDESADWDSIDVSREFEERVQEIADGAPDVYTHTRWQEFTDLAAWEEDITELGVGDGHGGSDLTNYAGVALYMIAERLAWALLEELAEGEPDSGGD